MVWAVLFLSFIARTGKADDPASGVTVTDKKPELVEPLFVRPLVKIESGRNDSNPVWSPYGTFVAFERSVGDKKEIHIALPDGTLIQTVYFLLSEGGKEMNFFFPGVSDETSYNAGITWSSDEYRFAYMSNGGGGNYDIYVQDLGGGASVRLTDHKEKDGQAHWSPLADRLVLVSGRTGNGDIYILDLRTRLLTRLTQGDKTYLFPQWSPDGKRLVIMHGSNENHDIILINDVTKPMESLKVLTTWPYDDLRPIWSPDGEKIAFYSNYNPDGDPKIWSIVVIAADGSDPTDGEGLAAKVVAMDVIPDVEVGPAWMPDSSRIVFVKNHRQEYNPIYVAELKEKAVKLLKTDTKMNHDVTCSLDGMIAFRAQVDQWDQIHVMKLMD
ncbi:MAG: PD40 domain-containing protein [Candidatus Altiarchaeota archaeon]|nr:PD40 domain-containing protein [Candidatus Altiarchaeota archaeon]